MSRHAEVSLQAPTPDEISAVYELHSQRSTATNEALVRLARLDSGWKSSATWTHALDASRFSMWLHQVLAFEYAASSLVACARSVARKHRSATSATRDSRKAAARKLWPRSGSAQRVYSELREMGLCWNLTSDAQFQHELCVAPRHYVWRDAWAHRGGRLRDYDEDAYAYFRQKSAIEERDGVAWPLDCAWSEARQSFRTLLDMLVAAWRRATL